MDVRLATKGLEQHSNEHDGTLTSLHGSVPYLSSQMQRQMSGLCSVRSTQSTMHHASVACTPSSVWVSFDMLNEMPEVIFGKHSANISEEDPLAGNFVPEL
eukprot:COSAG02_NODE_2023_length_10085_cov_2.117565_5_plen_101_part_00